jgi:hypothetical protein
MGMPSLWLLVHACAMAFFSGQSKGAPEMVHYPVERKYVSENKEPAMDGKQLTMAALQSTYLQRF